MNTQTSSPPENPLNESELTEIANARLLSLILKAMPAVGDVLPPGRFHSVVPQMVTTKTFGVDKNNGLTCSIAFAPVPYGRGKPKTVTVSLDMKGLEEKLQSVADAIASIIPDDDIIWWLRRQIDPQIALQFSETQPPSDVLKLADTAGKGS